MVVDGNRKSAVCKIYECVCSGLCGFVWVCVGVHVYTPHYNDTVGFDGDAPSTLVMMTKRWCWW